MIMLENAYTDKTIFIQIASYRDNQLLPTLKDMLDKADNPHLFHVCICHQHHPKDKWDTLEDYEEDARFTIIDIDSRKAKGACWARWRIQQEYKGEDFTFQLDSHHIFAKGWDTELKNMYAGLQLNGVKKPLITSYIPAYDADTGKPIDNEPWRLAYNYFGHDGPLHTLPETIPNWQGLGGPVRGRFYSAHFAFADGAFSKDVQHDPEMYFHGEEISIAVRAFTHGYDIFHPHKVIAWHHYGRKDARKHWDDIKDWTDTNTKSYERVRKLFGMNGEKFDKGECKKKYGFGKERTLDEYERFAGVRFKDQKIQNYTLDKFYPPNPIITNKKAYNDSFFRQFKFCIDLTYEQVPLDDYTFWAVAFENDEGEEVYRQDADPDEIKRLKNDPDEYCKIWRWFNTDDNIIKWRVWPHSEERGFCDPIEGIIGK